MKASVEPLWEENSFINLKKANEEKNPKYQSTTYKLLPYFSDFLVF